MIVKDLQSPGQPADAGSGRDDTVSTQYRPSIAAGGRERTEPKTICPRCQSPNIPGSFFCYTCGKYFADVDGTGRSKGKRARGAAQSPAPKAKVIMPDGSELVLTGDPVFIERADFAGMLPYETLMAVSRQHILISYSRGNYYIQDYGPEGKGSTNHTKVNGVDIYGKRKPLRDGDEIELAGQPELTLTFRLLDGKE
jgi:hypothetical protein